MMRWWNFRWMRRTTNSMLWIVFAMALATAIGCSNEVKIKDYNESTPIPDVPLSGGGGGGQSSDVQRIGATTGETAPAAASTQAVDEQPASNVSPAQNKAKPPAIPAETAEIN